MTMSRSKAKNEIIYDDVANLYEHPSRDQKHPADPENQLTMGDLHGNALKLVYFLYRQNVIDFDHYEEIINIYKKNIEELTKEDLDKFSRILKNARINPSGAIRLLGDELCDRGHLDYFTLKILEKMVSEGILVEIMISNHSVEFIEAYEKNKKFHPRFLVPQHAQSMIAMQRLIDKSLISREEVLHLANHYYKPCIKALSYTTNADKTKMTIYSHAGIGLTTIKALATKLNVTYVEKTGKNPVEELSKTIDNINSAFEEHVKNNTVHTLYTKIGMIKGYSNYGIDENENPLEFLIWNRNYDDLNRPEKCGGCEIDFVHAHDLEEEQTQRNVYILENDFGRDDNQPVGRYHILYSQEISSLKMRDQKKYGQEKDNSSLLFFKPKTNKDLVSLKILPTLNAGDNVEVKIDFVFN